MKTEGSSIVNDAKEGNYPDFLRIEDQQRYSENSGGFGYLKKMSPIVALQPKKKTKGFFSPAQEENKEH